ncbi:F-box protein At2g39490 [Papaver somniferum]|uniref:F-box protein At2g39490 n=1 Tax=Papaver somniferum TaxID=3469 RepID=UPI000E703549|nr:F-box protein At2g39490 [Papaver somniferum]
MGKKLTKKKKTKKPNQKTSNSNRNNEELVADHNDNALGDKRSIEDSKEEIEGPIKDYAHDHINSLHDEILSYIVSLLPLEFAFKTMILSSRWRDLWTHCTRGMYVDNDEKSVVPDGRSKQVTAGLEDTGEEDDIVSKVVENDGDILKEIHDGAKVDKEYENLKAIVKFLQSYGEQKFNRAEAEIARFFFFPSIEGENKLVSVDFSKEQAKPQGKNLTLNLVVDSRPTKNQILLPTTTLALYTVKTLHLRFVRNLTGDTASTLISRFYHLDSLVITECSDIKILTVKCRGLHHLTVLDCPNLSKLYVSVSYLEFFRYRGTRIPCLDLKARLTDVMLEFQNDKDTTGFQKFIKELTIRQRAIKTLTLRGTLFQKQIQPPGWLMKDANRPFNMEELCWIVTSPMNNSKLQYIESFLKICSGLQRIFFYMNHTASNDAETDSIELLMNWASLRSKPHKTCMGKTTRKIQDLELNHLQSIKLTDFKDEDDELYVINHILKDVKDIMKLKIIATSAKNGTRHLVKDTQEDSNDYVFLEQEETCTLHPKVHDYICWQ